MALLTAIIPIGINHRKHNLISAWQNTANEFSQELKIVIIEDLGSLKNAETQVKPLFLDLDNSETLVGNFNSPGVSRNIGLSCVNSRWVSFWDADDIPEVSNFIEMVKTANMTSYQIAIGQFTKFSNPNKIDFLPKKENNLINVVKEPGIWRMSFRVDLLADIKFENLSMAEDQLFLLDQVFYKKNIFYFQKKVYNYQTQNNLQLTNSTSVNQIALFLKLVNDRLRIDSFPIDSYSAQMITRIVITGLVSAEWPYKLKVISECRRTFFIKPIFAFRLLTYSPIIGSGLLRERICIFFKRLSKKIEWNKCGK
jgi:hypothetical protein